MPVVTVVVLNWNGKEVTEDCLRSLLASDYPDLCVVVVDNGSTDGSADYLSVRFPDLVILRNPVNLGFTGGSNQGIRHALENNADYILLLNNDTVVDRECVSHLVDAAESSRRYGALNPKIYYSDPPDRLWYAGGAFSLWRGVAQHWGRKSVDRGQYNALREVTYVSGCALLVRASVLRTVGLLDETLFIYAEDADLSVRIRKAGYRLAYVPMARLWHKEGFDTRQNSGQAYRYRLYIRNSLWVLTKHAQPVQLVVAVPYLLVNAVLRLAILSLVRRDIRDAIAPLQGVKDYLQMLFDRDRDLGSAASMPPGH
jgi:GT2 family glycosyltransferase